MYRERNFRRNDFYSDDMVIIPEVNELEGIGKEMEEIVKSIKQTLRKTTRSEIDSIDIMSIRSALVNIRKIVNSCLNFLE